VVAKVRERLAVNKQRSQRFDMERFNLKKLNELESKEQYRVEVCNKFAALEFLKLNGTHQLLTCAGDMNLLGDNINTIKKNIVTLTDASKQVGLEINVEKTK
jgi:hypothetical protein